MHLYSILSVNNDVCPLSELLQFNRLKWVSTTEPELLEAVSNSSLLTVIYLPDGSAFGISRVSSAISKTYDNSILDNTYARTSHSVYLNVSMSVSNPDVSSTVQATISSPSIPHSIGVTQSNSLQLSTSTSSSILQSSAVISGISMLSSPHNPPNYMLTSGYVNPNMVGTNAVANMFYSLPSQTQPNVTNTTLFSQFHQSNFINNVQTRPIQPAFFTPQFYSQLQAALVASANTPNQSALLTPGLVNHTLPSGDQNSSLSYRLNPPGNQTQFVGAYVPTVGNTVGFGGASNPAVFLQFIPGAHPNQPGTYFNPGSMGYLPSSTSLINRSMIPANPNEMWISLNPAANPAGNISTPYHLQQYVAFPHGHTNLQPVVSAANGVLYPNNPHSLSNSFTAVPLVRSDLPYGSQKVPNINSRGHLYMNQQAVSSNVNSIPSPIVSNHNSPLSNQSNTLNKRVV